MKTDKSIDGVFEYMFIEIVKIMGGLEKITNKYKYNFC